ncbi:hypothetical protein P872_20030 [Rhodonellum psychrophilum GCM71 = DSM 17998]|uniref:Uncharacterized protein n=1 Tax=Rhodonellum psychrophilum GCM71 = DSM 17998 TaxID=1123057 RepID=U5C083_9BACT|nr:hypothetical protein P872_20030 [Rhodonellum psychrophilum GCM71 = DSM 17998]
MFRKTFLKHEPGELLFAYWELQKSMDENVKNYNA